MMRTTEHLLRATQDIWAGYHTHPFVKGIADGTLAPEKFRYYIVQDYLYLQDYAKVFALGVAKAKSLHTTRLFAASLEALTGSEMDIHKGYMGRFAVTQDELDATPRALDNLSYTSYMLRVAYEMGEVEILAAVLSCAYSYELIAKKIVQSNPAAATHELFGEWVSGYASAQYAAPNVQLMDTLDRLTEGYTQAQLAPLVDIFTACSRYEMDFWQMAWEMSR